MDNQTKITTKLRVTELEHDNFDKLIVFESTNGFAKIIGHSAIFYAAHLAKRIGRRCYLRHDDDYYSPSKEGVISIKYNDDLLSRLTAINIRLDPSLSTDLIHVFRLPSSFTPTDLQRFTTELSADSRQLESLALPKSPIPTLYTYLRELSSTCFAALRHMPPIGRETLGDRLFLETHTLLALYIESAHEGLTSTRLTTFSKNIRHLKYQLQNLDNLHLLPTRDILRLFELATRIESLLTKIIERAPQHV